MSAIDRLRVLIWLETAALERRGIGEAHGDDWFELTEEEAQIFGLNLADLPSLVAVWMAFETVLGIADSLPHASAALVEDVRAELPWLAGSIERRALECYEFQRFCVCLLAAAQHPRPRTAMWILVLRPPRERPRA